MYSVFQGGDCVTTPVTGHTGLLAKGRSWNLCPEGRGKRLGSDKPSLGLVASTPVPLCGIQGGCCCFLPGSLWAWMSSPGTVGGECSWGWWLGESLSVWVK